MFEKAKKKFIKTSMISISTFFLLIIIFLNGANFIKSTNENDANAKYILANQTSNNIAPSDKDGIGIWNNPFITTEGNFDNRYIIIKYSDKTITNIDISHSVATKDSATKMGQIIIDSNLNKGYIGKYNFINDKENEQIILLNCEKSFHTIKNLIFLSLSIYVLGIITIYLIIRLYSNKILDPVKVSYEKQKQFITNASHELKTPLTIISANNELNEISNGNNEYIDNINKQVSKMNNMVKDLTLLAKMQEINNIIYSEVNISNLANEIIETFKPRFNQSNIELEYNIEDNLIINSDPKLLDQIFNIILDNSIKYSKSFFKLNITKNKKYISIEASNDSDEEDGNLNNLVDRFYRNKNNDNKIEGSGIGLSLLNEIIIQLAGKLNIYCKDKIFYINIDL